MEEHNNNNNNREKENYGKTEGIKWNVLVRFISQTDDYILKKGRYIFCFNYPFIFICRKHTFTWVC